MGRERGRGGGEGEGGMVEGGRENVSGGELDVDLVEACTRLALHFFKTRYARRYAYTRHFFKTRFAWLGQGTVCLACHRTCSRLLHLAKTSGCIGTR